MLLVPLQMATCPLQQLFPLARILCVVDRIERVSQFIVKRTEHGFDSFAEGFADRVLLVSLDPGLSRYTPERTRSFYAQLLERAASLPDLRHGQILRSAPRV